MAGKAIQVKVTGFKALQKTMKQINKKYRKATAAALYRTGLEIDEKSVPRVPVDNGDLKRSHYVAPPQLGLAGMECQVGYGTEYAVPVHERVEVFHQTGQPLFLSSVINETMATYEKDMAKKIARYAKANVGVEAISGDAPTRPSTKRGK